MLYYCLYYIDLFVRSCRCFYCFRNTFLYSASSSLSCLSVKLSAYSLSCTEADTLAECLASLDGCADCVHSKEKRSSRLAELPHGFKEDVYRAIRRLVHANNSAPAVTVRTVG
ncbi:unnamed protein product [Fusarium graminearum]|nr:unnamed protein product [Fusarium graminearum]